MVLVERRIGLLFAFFLCLILLAGLRSLQLGTLQGGKLAAAATSQQVSEPIVPAHRGTIVDRHGTELAVSQAADDVTATPYLVTDPVKAAQQLAPLLDVDEAAVLKQLVTSRHRLRLPRPPCPRRHRRQDPPARDRRHRLHARPAPHLPARLPRLAGARRRQHGRQGLRRRRVLAGLEAQRHRRPAPDRARRRRRRRPGPRHQARPARASEVELALDANIQDEVESVLGGIGKTYRPKGATAIVTNPQTGEILALANWPQINANDPSAAPDYARQNRAVGITYEPGSTFKAITVAGALEDGKVTPDTSFNLPPQIVVADRTIKNAEDARLGDDDHERRSWPSPTTSARSRSASGSASSASTTTSASSASARSPAPTSRARSRASSRSSRTTPAPRWATSRSARARRSRRCRSPSSTARSPTAASCARRTSCAGSTARLQRQRKARRIMSAATAASLRTMLEGVLAPGGTASEVKPIPGYTLAGKTGTANKIDPVTHEYSQSDYVASFVGFAPARNPKLLISIMVDEPKGGDLRRAGRGAGVRQDRQLRPAVPEDPPEQVGVAEALRLPMDLTGQSCRRSRVPRPCLSLWSPRCSWATSSRTPRCRTSTSPRWPTTRAPSRPARSSSACAASRPTATATRPTRSPTARSRWWSTTRWISRVPEVLVEDVRAAMAPAAARLAGDPTAELAMVGITGTNGKTTTSYLTRALLEAAGRQTGLIGTVTSWVGGVERAGRAHDARGDRPAARCSARCATAGTPRRSWRSPRTRCRCTAPTRSTGTSPRSPTSRRTTSTSMPTWRTTSWPSGGCSRWPPSRARR